MTIASWLFLPVSTNVKAVPFIISLLLAAAYARLLGFITIFCGLFEQTTTYPSAAAS
ncbi:hypothetical protein KCP73_11055 [Salmonella enterica subsp. enterica]|nr:hypothetical protein KCP73_11055 [Salmonella enterica subsp. enterica]